jgi:hypothetical protein
MKTQWLPRPCRNAQSRDLAVGVDAALDICHSERLFVGAKNRYLREHSRAGMLRLRRNFRQAKIPPPLSMTILCGRLTRAAFDIALRATPDEGVRGYIESSRANARNPADPSTSLRAGYGVWGYNVTLRGCTTLVAFCATGWVGLAHGRCRVGDNHCALTRATRDPSTSLRAGYGVRGCTIMT